MKDGRIAAFAFLLIFSVVGLSQVAPLHEPRRSPDAWHEDLIFLSNQLVKRHANVFHFISAEAFHSEVQQLDERIPKLNPDEIFVGMDQIASSIGDGHTSIRIPADAPVFPMEFRRFGDAYRLTAAAPGPSISPALGHKLIAIDGVPIERVHSLLLTLTPADETLALRELRAILLINNGMVLHGLGVTSKRDTASYTFEGIAGDAGTIHVDAGSTIPPSAWQRAETAVPLFRQHPDEPLWCDYFEPQSAVYCSFQSYNNLRETSKTVFDMLRDKHAQHLILDMRLNRGGDFDLGLKYLVDPIRKMDTFNRDGHLFVLIGAGTFSAAMSNAAHFRERTHAILVGQPIGEKPNSYQEAREVTLPNSHWTLRYSVKFYRFTKGSENLIRPDKDIPETWDDFKAGRDPVLDWVLQACSTSRG